MDTATRRMEQAKRGVRAMIESRRYVIRLGAVTSIVANAATGEMYDCTAHTCTCGDFQYRGAATGLRCKHLLAVKLARGAR